MFQNRKRKKNIQNQVSVFNCVYLFNFKILFNLQLNTELWSNNMKCWLFFFSSCLTQQSHQRRNIQVSQASVAGFFLPESPCVLMLQLRRAVRAMTGKGRKFFCLTPPIPASSQSVNTTKALDNEREILHDTPATRCMLGTSSIRTIWTLASKAESLVPLQATALESVAF